MNRLLLVLLLCLSGCTTVPEEKFVAPKGAPDAYWLPILRKLDGQETFKIEYLEQDLKRLKQNKEVIDNQLPPAMQK